MKRAGAHRHQLAKFCLGQYKDVVKTENIIKRKIFDWKRNLSICNITYKSEVEK